MSGEDTRRRVSAALDMPGGLDAPLHAKLREDLARDPESAQWAADVQKLDALLHGWPEDARSEAAWEGLAARIEQRLSEALPAGLDFTTSPFFDDEDARMSRPDASSGRVKTDDARRELEAKRAEFSLSKLSHLDAPKAPAVPPPPPRAGNPKLAVVPTVPASAAPLPNPAARPQGEERFSIPTFTTPLAPLAAPSLQTGATEAKAKRTPWLLYGGSALAAAAVVLIAVLVLPKMSREESEPAAATAASAPPAMQGAAMAEGVAMAPTSPSTATPAAMPTEAAEPSAARMIAAPVVAPAPPPISGGAIGGLPMGGAGRGAIGAADEEDRASAPRAVAAAARPRGAGGAIEGSAAVRTGGGGTGGGSAARPGGSKAGPSAGPMPAAPSRADVIAAMASVRGAVATCAGGRGGVAQVRVTFSGPSGRVMNAVMEGQFAGTPQGSCIARAVRAASVPRFSQPSVTVSYPFQI